MYGNDPFAYDLRQTLEESRARARDREERRERADAVNRALYWRVAFPDLSAPTQEQLEKHAKLFGTEGIAEAMRTRGKPQTPDELAAASRARELEAAPRKRSRRRTGVKEDVAELLKRRPDLMPSVVADVLNISDRRAKQIIAELRKAA